MESLSQQQLQTALEVPASQLIRTDIAKLIYYMYSTQQQDERQAIMNKLQELGKCF